MGKRKVIILEPAVEEHARITLYIEDEGLPVTAKSFVDDSIHTNVDTIRHHIYR